MKEEQRLLKVHNQRVAKNLELQILSSSFISFIHVNVQRRKFEHGHMIHVTRHTSHVKRYACDTRDTSHITRRTSQVTCHMSAIFGIHSSLSYGASSSSSTCQQHLMQLHEGECGAVNVAATSSSSNQQQQQQQQQASKQ